MAEIVFLEVIKGIGRLFLHPVFYFSFILAVIAGLFRVKRERRDFHVKVHDSLHELRHLLPVGIIVSLILSMISIAIGFVLPMELIISIAIATVLLGLIGNARLLSPAFSIGIPLLMAVGVHLIPWKLPVLATIQPIYLVAAAFLLGILLLTEAILLGRDGTKDVSPKLRTSRRGLTVGALQAKRFWLLPFFLFLPNGPITSPVDWWPVIHWGTESYSVILLPFLLGFQQQIQTTLPEVAIKRLGKQIIWLGLLVTMIASISFFYPIYGAAAAAFLAIVGRIWIAYRHRVQENQHPYYFTPRNSGVMILGVLPNSPANKMGLKTGEIIQVCNHVPVSNKQQLFEALLINRAYCKLEVLDTNNEIRLVQGALYEGDHHELGILFIEKRQNPNKEQAV